MADSIISTGGTGTFPYYDVDVCNLALSSIGNADNYVTATTLTNNSTKEGRLCNLWYHMVLKLALTQAQWKCSLVREYIKYDEVAEIGKDYGYVYTLPDDCLLIESISDDADNENPDLAWKREGRLIYTDAYDTIYVTYVTSDNDSDELDVQFVNYLVASLALAIAPSLMVDERTMVRLERNVKTALLMGLGADRKENYESKIPKWTKAGR